MSAHLVKTIENADGSTTFQEIKPTLSQQAQLTQLKEGFEKAFGKDQESRTQDQWRNLVGRYGIEFVSKQEKMSMDDIMQKMDF